MGLTNVVRKFADSRLGSLLVALSIFLPVVQYCWIAEHAGVFEKVAKIVDARLFLLCVAACVLGTLRSWSGRVRSTQSKSVGADPDVPFLPREQTEEWKGWMQGVILLYHYFGLSKNLPVYQVIRVIVAAYIFLTGYSHTSYFLTNNDFSTDRTARVLLRLNLLSCVLAYVMDKSWDFYYFPGLTSFWYLVILITTRISRTPAGNFNMFRLFTSFTISCALVQVLLYSEIGKKSCVLFLTRLYMIGGPRVRPQELNFRLKLDSLMPYWGAALAILVKTRKDQTNTRLQQSSTVRARYRCVVAHMQWTGLSVIVAYFLTIQEFRDKETSNKWHPFISIIPIASMLAVRNAKVRWQHGFNHALRWLGSISLEAYILQSHTWLTNNNKDLLRLNLAKCLHVRPDGILSLITACFDRLIITVVYLTVSHFAANATKRITDWLMSGSRSKITVLLVCCWMLNLHWTRLLSVR